VGGAGGEEEEEEESWSTRSKGRCALISAFSEAIGAFRNPNSGRGAQSGSSASWWWLTGLYRCGRLIETPPRGIEGVGDAAVEGEGERERGREVHGGGGGELNCSRMAP
jgi:hypothetical protein